MDSIKLLTSKEVIVSPTFVTVHENSGDPICELVYKSTTINSTLFIRKIVGIGTAFWFWKHENIEWGKMLYQAHGTGPSWVSLGDKASLDLVRFYDGQDFIHDPRAMYIDDKNAKCVLEDYLVNGKRSGSIEWTLEDELTERLGAEGAFDGIE